VIKQILKIAAFVIVFFLIAGGAAFLTLTLITKSQETVIIPKLVGKDVVYTLEILSDLGLNTKVTGSEYSRNIAKNFVLSQEPVPGEQLKKGRTVKIIISKGTKSVTMPKLTGMPLQQARIILEENGLNQGNLSKMYCSDIRKNSIAAQSLPPGSVTDRGADIDLLISLGTRPVAYKMIDLNGLSMDDAILLIERNSLLLGEIKSSFKIDKPENVIISQEPAAGERVFEANIINLVINRKSGEKRYGSDRAKNRLFTYRVDAGFLKKRIRVSLNSFGFTNDIFNNFMKPGEELWLIIPSIDDATVFLYEGDELVRTEIFDSK